MKKINDLKSERTALIEKMSAIVELSGKEKRAKTDDEAKNWNDHNERIERIDAEVIVLERQEELNKSIVKKTIVTPEEKVAKRYDLSKAIQAKLEGRALSGLEAEMHQEGIKEYARAGKSSNGIIIPSMLLSARANEESKTTGAAGGHIPTAVSALDVTTTRPLYRELGCTVYEGLKGKIDLPFSTGHVADFSNTEITGAAAGSNPTLTKGTLSAERVQGWKKYSKEYLAESVVMGDMLTDMVESIERAISNRVATTVRDANELTGFVTGTDVTAAITWNGVLDIIAALTSDNFRREGFVMSKQLFFELAAMERATNTAQFVVKEEKGGAQQGSIFGVPAFGTAAMAVQTTDDYAIAYGDFSKAYVGKWGGIELLVDPYTGSDYGLVKITFSQLADVVVNALGFASKTNVAIS